MTLKQVQQILSIAKKEGLYATEQEMLCRHTTFRIGGPAAVWVEVGEEQALCKVMKVCSEEEIPCFIIGNGSNLLVSDEGYDGVVLHLGAPEFSQCRKEGQEVVAGAAVRLSALTEFAKEEGLSGLEFAYGIPGSVGGAAFMNAGAYGGEVGQVIRSCRALTKQGTVCEFSGKELQFGYRSSVFLKEDLVVLSVRFALTPDDPQQIAQRMKDYLQRRKSKQPLEYPSAGSVFKRPEGHFAGALIEQCGLKGLTVGGAQVSKKHAGFIINTGNATCRDVLELIEQIRQTVRRETGVVLECEIKNL